MTAFLGQLGREVLRLGEDRIRVDLPRRIDEVDAEDLSAWLGRRVTVVHRLDTTRGTTDRARFALEGTDVPASVFVKIPASKAVIRLFGNLAGLGENELRFYREVRPKLELTAPVLLGSAVDARTKRYALVLDDLAAAGASFADATTSLDPAQVLLVLDDLARLHGTYWESPLLATDLRWVRANRDDPLLPAIHRALRSMAPRIARDAAELVPADGMAILAAYPSIADQLDRGPHTILHGDPHPGNCYFLGGRAGLFDWQVLRRGHPIRDVAYHLVLALDRDTRRAVEHDLLGQYCEALAAHGGPAIEPDAAWTTYRRMAAGPYVAATFTVGLAGMQRDDIARSGLRRSVAAISDLGTAAALDLEPVANPPRDCGEDPAVGEPSDAAVIAASIDHPVEFGAIFDRHASSVRRYLVRRLGPAESDDILGEVFRIAFERRHTYDQARPSARPWLYGIATNLVSRHRRREARRIRAVARLAGHRLAGDRVAGTDHAEQVSSAVDARDRWMQVADAVTSLPEAELDVLVLHVWEGLSYEEVAVVVGAPVGTVRSRLNRARRHLRELAPVPGEQRGGRIEP